MPDPNAVPAPQEETVDMTIKINKSRLLSAMEKQADWQKLFFNDLPIQCMNASNNLKLFALNGFQPIASEEQFKAAEKKLIDLERPIPQIHIMPANAKLPTNVEDQLKRKNVFER